MAKETREVYVPNGAIFGPVLTHMRKVAYERVPENRPREIKKEEEVFAKAVAKRARKAAKRKQELDVV